MFSDPDVIKASRKFICVRIDSYESEENQKIVRSHLGGRFENTAFCVIAPDGEERLTRSGRGPQHISRDFDDIAAIADRYKSRGDILDSHIPDFNSFALALNVSSADQKILLLIAGDEDEIAAASKRIRSVVWNKNVMGRFNYDFESDGSSWTGPLSSKSIGSGFHLIRPGEFGLEGQIVKSLPLNASNSNLLQAMVVANRDYAKSTKKKVYSSHVVEGRRQGKRIEMAMPFGEDRDGDGKIDHRAGSGNRRR